MADSNTYSEQSEIKFNFDANLRTEQEKADFDEKPPTAIVKHEGFLTKLLTTPPPDAFEWYKPTYGPVALPAQTIPYFPPNIPLQPIEKHEPIRTKSPFLEALTIAPVRSFTPFENDVITQFEDLPLPVKEVKFVEALTTAPEEPVHKFNPDLPEGETAAETAVRLEKEKHEKEASEVKEQILKTVNSQLSKKCTSFAPLKGYRSVNPFKPMPPFDAHKSSIPSLTQCQSRSSSVCAVNVENQSNQYHESEQIDQTQTTTNVKNIQSVNACHTKDTTTTSTNRNSFTAKKTTAFPPPPGTPTRSYVQSGLSHPHRQSTGLENPNKIPKYQRQWFNLPSQSPIRTPEPTELRENVPIAFIDTHQESSETISKPIAITISAPPQIIEECVEKSTAESSFSAETTSTAPIILPSLNENRAGPITMTFQTIEPSQLPPRPTTPSLINKPPPLVPYYQQNLVCEQYPSTSAQLYDPHRRTPSPRPDAIKSPAPGPPPNVLKIQAPRLKPDLGEYTPYGQTGTYGSSGLKTFNQTTNTQSLSESTRGYELSSQSFTQKPETLCTEQRDGLNIQTRTTGSASNEAKKSDLQSSSTYQVGNTQIQRQQRVVEEYEHTQKASTIEIRKNYDSSSSQQSQQIQSSCVNNNFENTDSYGKGFVARQARRLSETSQQSSKNIISSYRFPQSIQPLGPSGFPISASSSVADAPREQAETEIETINVAPPEKTLSVVAPREQICPSATPSVQSIQSIQSTRPFQPNKNVRPVQPVQKIAFPPPLDLGAYASQQQQTANNNLYSTNLAINASQTKQQLSSSSASITSAFQSLTNAGPSAFSSNPNNNNNKFTPGYQPSNNNNKPSTVVSDPNPANKGTSNVSATSTPKRGRGVLNASVAPGGRIPKCGCCSTQIR